jgi:hypothetical protein
VQRSSIIYAISQFCERFVSFFRTESCSPTAAPSLKMSSLRLTSILDDCCSSIEQLKSHAADSFTPILPTVGVVSSPTISEYLRVSCVTAATTARMVAVASAPSISHAVAAASVNVLQRIQVVILVSRSDFGNNILTFVYSASAC